MSSCSGYENMSVPVKKRPTGCGGIKIPVGQLCSQRLGKYETKNQTESLSRVSLRYVHNMIEVVAFVEYMDHLGRQIFELIRQ